ncbi:GIY-YIG nuclease family protein [Streptomyces salinarius]|uniref:GIY-YIG nuclease family protein n=1 Tax=Streptomyces salinarius TaxID=2762598 RepID=UPI0028527E3F|nr:GIY-YIG nuclease family protein [Streptomyces salinarius]
MRDIEHLPTAVYRLRDRAGRMLYIGMTNNPEQRWYFHERRHWWHQVTDRDVQWYPDRATARRMEAAAIKSEAPLHNSVHVEPGPHETPLTRARARLTDVIERVRERHEPHWFTARSRRRVVLLHPEVYEAAIRNDAIVAALQDADPGLYERLAAEASVAAQD